MSIKPMTDLKEHLLRQKNRVREIVFEHSLASCDPPTIDPYDVLALVFSGTALII